MPKRYRLPLYAAAVSPLGSRLDAASDGWFYPRSAAEAAALLALGCEVDDTDALGLASGQLGLSLANSDERYVLAAGVIRNFNDGQGWRLITKPEVASHYSANLGSVVTNAGDITVDLSSLGGMDVVSAWACPDEVMSRAGMRVGASITPSAMKLYIQTPHVIADYVSYNGSSWSSASGVFTPTFSSSILTLTHTSTPIDRNGYDLSVTPRSTVVDAVAGSANATSCQVQFIDRATNTVLSAPTTECKVYVSRGLSQSGVQTDEDPRNIHEGTYPGANIWIGVILRKN